MKFLSFLFFCLLTSNLSQAGIVYYKDEEGNLHAADSPDLIPEKYRKKLKRISSDGSTSTGSNLAKESFKLELSAGKAVILASISGKELYMIVDPAMEYSVIPSSMVGALGLKVEGNAEIDLGKGKITALISTVPEIGIKQFQVRKMKVFVTELKGLGKAEGILGADYFNNFRLIQEPEKGSITLERK
jgi:hypothetical protein